jgi:hypothetical protein
MFVFFVATADCRLRLTQSVPMPCQDLAASMREYCIDDQRRDCAWGRWTCTASYRSYEIQVTCTSNDYSCDVTFTAGACSGKCVELGLSVVTIIIIVVVVVMVVIVGSIVACCICCCGCCGYGRLAAPPPAPPGSPGQVQVVYVPMTLEQSEYYQLPT